MVIVSADADSESAFLNPSQSSSDKGLCEDYIFSSLAQQPLDEVCVAISGTQESTVGGCGEAPKLSLGTPNDFRQYDDFSLAHLRTPGVAAGSSG